MIVNKLNKYYTINGVFEGEDYNCNWGKLHRLEGPAVELYNGSKQWFISGKRHRDDGPAIVWTDGDEEWYKDGKRHRDDGPAIEWVNGDKEWWLEGVGYTEKNFHKEIERRKKIATKDTEYHDLVWYTVFGDITPKQLLHCMHDGCEEEALYVEFDDNHWHDWIWCKKHSVSKKNIEKIYSPLKGNITHE